MSTPKRMKSEVIKSVKARADKKKMKLPPRIDRVMGESSEEFINSFKLPDTKQAATAAIDRCKGHKIQQMRYEFRKTTPDEFKEAHLWEHFNQPIPADVIEWIESKSWILYIHGENGRGKTHLAFATAFLSIKLNLAPASWMSTPDLLADLRAAFNKPYKGIVENVRSFKGLLLLDDIGAEKDTEFSIQELYRILYYREAWRLKTIVTCNYSITELAEKLDGRIASRLAGGVSIVLKGRDRRLSKGGQ